MLRVGLTGGIGAGKSAVATLLSEFGAVTVDGDRIARSLVAPGEPALADIVASFGPQVLLPDGQLDRAGLAGVVFADEPALARLDAIMHPRIAERAEQLMAAAAADGVDVVVYDMPLIVENGTADDFDVLVVVQAPLATRLARLEGRGISAEDARRRVARQATDEQRAAVADVLLDNSGDLTHLREQVRRVWDRLPEIARGRRRGARGSAPPAS